MGQEIERKFLVDMNLIGKLYGGDRISQGYIETAGNGVVRARIRGNDAYLTVKGEVKGITCSEFEYKIQLSDAEKIIDEICTGGTINKTRYTYLHKGSFWEIDVFHGENTGLVVAEVELKYESESIHIPPWVVTEVTGINKYYNVSLLSHPYTKWNLNL